MKQAVCLFQNWEISDICHFIGCCICTCTCTEKHLVYKFHLQSSLTFIRSSESEVIIHSIPVGKEQLIQFYSVTREWNVRYENETGFSWKEQNLE
jgi:hypothetical protein